MCGHMQADRWTQGRAGEPPGGVSRQLRASTVPPLGSLDRSEDHEERHSTPNMADAFLAFWRASENSLSYRICFCDYHSWSERL